MKVRRTGENKGGWRTFVNKYRDRERKTRIGDSWRRLLAIKIQGFKQAKWN